jgi:hypothetical protein
MAGNEQPVVPIWAESKAKKQIDVLREVSRTLEEAERIQANQPIGQMTETDLEAEQLRLEELLHEGEVTVDEFRRLREIDFYLHEMRERREEWAREEWKPESLGD